MISNFSVKKPYTVLVAVIIVIVLGVISFTGMSTDLLPSLDLPYIIVMTSYPGATPEEVETFVTRPLESVLGTAGGLNNIDSVSRENSSMIFLEYTQGTNMDSATIELSGNIDLLADHFPDDVGRPVLMRISPDMLPIMIASVDMDGKDLAELSNLLEEQIIPHFERIPGVAAVSADGLLEERAIIVLNEEKIEQLNKKVVSEIESEIDKTRKQLEEAKAELTVGREKLESELPEQKDNIVQASISLNEAIIGIQAILAEENVIKAQKAAFEQEKAILDSVIEQAGDEMPDFPPDIDLGDLPSDMDLNDILSMIDDFTGDLSEGMEQLANVLIRRMAVDAELQNINVRLMTLEAMKPELEKGLEQSYAAYQELEKGKISLAIEISKAQMQMEQGAAELEKALAELDKAENQAIEQASLENMLTPQMLGQLIAAQNLSMPAGYVSDGANRIPVKVGEAFSDVDELNELLLFSLDSIGDIRLSDIADLEIDDNSDELYARVNGQPGIILSFQKQSIASTAVVAEAVNDEIEYLTGQYEGLGIVPLMDQGDYINLITGSVIRNLLFGGLLAVLILVLFLKDIKPTLVIAFSIPISLMFALTMMFFTGVNLNIISLSGLALGVGMLVDNSIVVIENIYRLRNDNVPSAKAAVKGARQMAGAITASTLTTASVFLPIVFTEGLSRELFSDMGLTIAYSLFASLIVALSVIPSMSSTMLKNTKEKSHPWFDKMVKGYVGTLRFSLKYKFIVIVFAVSLLGLSIFGALNMGLEFIPEMDSPQMSASLSLPEEEEPGDNLDLIDEVSERILNIEAVEYVGALSGGMGMGFSNQSSIEYYILLKDDRTLSNLDVERLIYEKTDDMDVELVVQSSTMDLSMLGGSGIQIMIKGSDLDILANTAADIAQLVKDVEGTAHVEWQGQADESEIRIIVDKDEAMRNNLTIAQVFRSMSSALQENFRATTITAGRDEVLVVIENPEKHIIDVENILEYNLRATDMEGREIEVVLGDVASLEEGFSPLAIRRSNQSRYITVSTQIAEGYNINNVNDGITKALENYELPEGYFVEMAGERETIVDSLDDLILVMLLGILFIYLIMVAQFQSLLAPFIVILTIPLAFTGGVLFIWILGLNLSVIAMLGFLVLTGIIVNNGIVFVSTVNQFRLEGESKKAALIKTGKVRIRPIIMTALTTILAMSTLAFGFGTGAELIQPMAIVTIGGMFYATLLTLLFVPVMYDILYRRDIKKIDTGEENEK